MEDLPLKGSYYNFFSMPGGPIAGGLEIRAGCFEVRAGCFEVRSQVALKSHVRAPSRYQETNFEPNFFNFKWVFGPSDQNELYQSPSLSKI